MFARFFRRIVDRSRSRGADPVSYRIPLDQAEHVLATFGVTRPTPAYERWVKDDGFDLKDFDSVLFESPFIIGVDWREPLESVLEDVAAALDRLGVSLRVEPRDALAGPGEAAAVSCEDGAQTVVSHGPADDDFDAVFRGLRSVVPAELEFRAWSGNHGGDSWAYAVLPRDEWADLERRSPRVIAFFFQPLPAG